MCKINEVISLKGKNYKRVSLKKVKSLIMKNGLMQIFVAPCKAEWCSLFEGEIDTIENFEKWINEVYYYNCNNELGKYLNYYICEY